MDVARSLRNARLGQGLTLRELASRAGTSHSTLAAYEAGRKHPGVATFDRILRAAGYRTRIELDPAIGGADPEARGRELVEVLDLAEQFPARHEPDLSFPGFAAP